MHTTALRLAKSGSSARWLARQRADPYANTSSHYVSRAAAKLEQIDSRFRLFPYSSSSSQKQSTECNVVDLGAAPGSCASLSTPSSRSLVCFLVELPRFVLLYLSGTQYIHSRISKLPQSRLVAVDLLDLDELRIPATTFIQGDFTQAATQSRILEALGGQQASVVVSDMLHNTTGNRERDAAVSLYVYPTRPCRRTWTPNLIMCIGLQRAVRSGMALCREPPQARRTLGDEVLQLGAGAGTGRPRPEAELQEAVQKQAAELAE